MYVGSANATEAAWGAQQLLKSGRPSVLRVANWECGVVVPVSGKVMGKCERGKVPGWEVFKGTVEVPFVVEGEKVGAEELWCWREHEGME